MEPENKYNISDCKLFQIITHATSKLDWIIIKVKKKWLAEAKYSTQKVDL